MHHLENVSGAHVLVPAELLRWKLLREGNASAVAFPTPSAVIPAVAQDGDGNVVKNAGMMMTTRKTTKTGEVPIRIVV